MKTLERTPMGDPMLTPTSMPFRPALRANRHRSRILSLAGVLTERDQQILLDPNEHRVLPTTHIAKLHFPSGPHVGAASCRCCILDVLA